jgi:ABC-type transport system involved in multi-copper enzyme maturation permease subunit
MKGEEHEPHPPLGVIEDDAMLDARCGAQDASSLGGAIGCAAGFVILRTRNGAHPSNGARLFVTSQIATIARFTLLEALRTRLPQLVAAVAILLVGGSFFVHEIAVIEAARLQTGFYAASARLASVFIAGLYVLISITREFNDKGLEVLLALDLPRSHYILGKLAGFLAIGVVIALIAVLPLFALAPPAAALQWAASLALELGIIVALALFCVLTFSQLMPAASFLLAFYLLARSLTAIRLMGAAPISGAGEMSHRLIRLVLDSLGLVVPALDQWTRTAWLVNGTAGWDHIAWLAGQGAVYVALLVAAAMFDFYRKNF